MQATFTPVPATHTARVEASPSTVYKNYGKLFKQRGGSGQLKHDALGQR